MYTIPLAKNDIILLKWEKKNKKKTQYGLILVWAIIVL